MQHTSSVLLALALFSLVLSSCELDDDTGDDGTGEGETRWVMISDNPSNATSVECTSSPGADIDALELLDAEGYHKAWVEQVIFVPAPEGFEPCPGNQHANPEAVVGPPDATAEGGSGYFSLNRGDLKVAFDTGVVPEPGVDFLLAYEVSPSGEEETVSLYIAEGSNGEGGGWREVVTNVLPETAYPIIEY